MIGHTRLSEDTINIKLLFFSVMELTIEELESKMVDPRLILEILPPNIASEFKCKEELTLQDLFKFNSPLIKKLNWFDFNLLQQLVDGFGDQDCKQELEAYIIILTLYLQSRSRRDAKDCEFHRDAPEVSIVIDPEWDEHLVKNASEERSYIAGLLGTTWNRISFIEAPALCQA